MGAIDMSAYSTVLRENSLLLIENAFLQRSSSIIYFNATGQVGLMNGAIQVILEKTQITFWIQFWVKAWYNIIAPALFWLCRGSTVTKVYTFEKIFYNTKVYLILCHTSCKIFCISLNKAVMEPSLPQTNCLWKLYAIIFLMFVKTVN